MEGKAKETVLTQEVDQRLSQCVQLSGSDLAAGTMMMTVLSQMRSKSHFSGGDSKSIVVHTPEVVIMGPESRVSRVRKCTGI